MVDISAKAETARSATAETWLLLSSEAWNAVATGSVPKGDVLAVSRIAGIQAAKMCATLIPLCHPLLLSGVRFEIALCPAAGQSVAALPVGAPPVGAALPKALAVLYPGCVGALRFCATVNTTGRTGVEMEAITAAQIAATSAYDMLKAVDKGLVIAGTRLLAKSGGKSGDFRATDW
jgi:cyclic pyranopterin phosphate synthase